MTVFLLDMDGVIANFIGGLIRSHKWPIEHRDFDSWNYHRELGVTDEEMWKPTREPGWWERLDPYPWAGKLIDELDDKGEVIFCSSPSLCDSCPSQKVTWLRNHGFMSLNSNDYQMGPRKELNALSGAVLIDDSDSNVDKYRKAGGEAVLFPQPWNENRKHMSEPVSYTLNEVFG